MEVATSAKAGPRGMAANQNAPTRGPANDTRATACCWGSWGGRGRCGCGGFEILPQRSMSGTTATDPRLTPESSWRRPPSCSWHPRPWGPLPSAPAAPWDRDVSAPTPGVRLAVARSAPGWGVSSLRRQQLQPGSPAGGPRPLGPGWFSTLGGITEGAIWFPSSGH